MNIVEIYVYIFLLFVTDLRSYVRSIKFENWTLKGRKQVRLFGIDLESLYPNPLGSHGKTVQSRLVSNL